MKVFGVLAFAAACGFPQPTELAPDSNGDDAPPCADCQLVAIEPSVAKTGETVTLEGTFGTTATVNFPGGASVSATILGAHRATVIVPAEATTGDLTLTVGAATVGSVAFRRASFALGLQSFNALDEQATGGRQMPSLVNGRRYHTSLVIGSFVYVIGGVNSASQAVTAIERATINADGSLGAFTPVTATLNTKRYYHASVVVGSYVYVIGGMTTGDVELDSVERATINADGSLGAFTAVDGVTLKIGRHLFGLSVAGNSLYAVGGAATAVPGLFLSDVERATINPDGSIGTFDTVTGVSLTVARAAFSVAVIGPYLYAVAGQISSASTPSVERAAINPDGSLGSFAVVTGLVTSRNSFTIAATGSSLSVIGGLGDNGVQLNSIERAQISTDGLLGTFSTVSAALPIKLAAASSAVAGNFYYLIGGVDALGTGRSGVLRATIDDSSGLAAPSSLGRALATARTRPSVMASGTRVYAIGGAGTNSLGSVEAATIAPDGSVGAFAVVPGLTLVTPRSGFVTATIGSFAYVIGGVSGSTYLTSIERAPINADGSLGAFTTVVGVNLVSPRFTAIAAVLGNFVYVISGEDSPSHPVTTVERAAIHPDGSIDTFATFSTTLGVGRDDATLAVVGTNLYVIGGWNGASRATIERAPIAADGTLGGFATVSGVTLTTPRAGASSVVVGSSLLVANGADASSQPLDTIDTATIAADGSISTFAISSVRTTSTREAHRDILLGNALVILGGENGSGLLTEIDQAPLR